MSASASRRRFLRPRGLARCLATACAVLGLGGGTSHAELMFTEPFQYQVGTNLAGQSGGAGFSGAWSGGNSTIGGPLVGGTGSSLIAGNSISQRTLASAFSTSGTSIYLTYLMQASNFAGGNYTGISLWNGGSEEMFMGIPYLQQKFGFDAHGGLGVGGIKSVDFSPATNTPYLVVLGLVPSATVGKVDVKMWATNDLNVNASTLVAGAPNAELVGSRNNFSFDALKVNGDYSGALKVSGLAGSPNAAEAAAATTGAVPEIDPGRAAGAVTLVLGVFAWFEKKARRRSGNGTSLQASVC